MKEKKSIKNRSIRILIDFHLLFKIIIIFFPITNLCSQCDYDHPFLKDGNCQNSCLIEELDNDDCILENEIVKTQWINNIIYLSETNYIYINMITTKNDDLIIVMSSFSDYPASNVRVFYGLNNEGRGFFKQNNIESKIFTNSASGSTIYRYESEIFMVKLQSLSETKEYIFEYGKSEQKIQIYDIEDGFIYNQDFSTVFHYLQNIIQIMGAKVVLSSSDYNYYLIGLLYTKYINSIGYTYLSLIKFRITYITGYITVNQYYNDDIATSNSKAISCYETSTKDIICFYQNPNKEYTVGAFENNNLQLLKTGKLQDGNDNEDIFYKCVHFFGEIGAFIYYSNDNPPYAIISFIKYCHGSNSITSYYNNITFTNYSFYYDLILNDVIKVSDKKIYFVALSLNKYDLFIITLNNYYQEKIIYRIYKTYSFLYSYHYFYNTIRLEIYNNFLALGANGFGNNGTSFSSLTIFSYPNSTDLNITIIDLLLNDNEINIKNIKLEIINLCKIENNMFGLILTGIKIDEIYKITNEYLSLDDGTEISNNMTIDINETLKLNIPKTNNIYKKFKYGMKYACQAKEPKFEKYNKYPIEVNDTGIPNNAIDYFERKTYFGRHSYYYFVLDNKLTEEDCEENCELCYNDDKNKCVTCIYNDFEITRGKKICNELLITTILETILQGVVALQKETTIPIVTTTTLIETTVQKDQNIIPISEICTIKEIINGICGGILTDEMANDIFLYIKNELINKNFTKENLIINTPHVAFQLTTVNYQKNNNLNISTVDLGECQNTLRKEYNISKEYSLIP